MVTLHFIYLGSTGSVIVYKSIVIDVSALSYRTPVVIRVGALIVVERN